MRGLIGKKIGMTRVFNSMGHSIPVTVLEVGPCHVTQIKTVKKDGYDSVQLGFLELKKKLKLQNLMQNLPLQVQLQ